jgi:hypothetical protein
MVVQNTVFLQMNSLYPTVKKGFLNGISITYKMVKVIVPCYIAIEFIEHLGLIEAISTFFKPCMGIFGLPENPPLDC